MKSSFTMRRGVALVLVLGLVTLTLAVSYALLRTQAQATRVSLNDSRRGSAKNAAQTAIALALRKMHDDTWPGVEQSISGTLDASGLTGYSVSYTTGDSELAANAPNYAEWPYRVTLLATGYSCDPVNNASRSEYRIRMVVKLSPRQLNTNSLSAAGLESYSLYKVDDSDVKFQYPIQFNGNVMLQGKINFCPDYPNPKNGAAYNRYFADLWKLKEDGRGDFRPFTGTLTTKFSKQTTDFTNTIQTVLRTTTVDDNIPDSFPCDIPNGITTYRLYNRGRAYTAVVLPTSSSFLTPWSRSITSGTYAPDPQTNPLGIFVVNSTSVAVGSNTSITGTVLSIGSETSSDLHVTGNNITLARLVLPRLAGSTENWSLPVAMAEDDVLIYDGNNRSVTGLVVAGHNLNKTIGLGTMQLTMTGCCLCKSAQFEGQLAWFLTSSLWDTALSDFIAGNGMQASSYLPEWLGLNKSGFYLQPKLQFTPATAGTRYHVPDNWSNPIFVPHASDGGLLWEVVDVQEPYLP